MLVKFRDPRRDGPLFRVGRHFYLDAITSAGGSEDAAAAAYNQILSFLRLAAQSVLVLALLVALGAWLAGPGKIATRIRTRVHDVRARGDVEGGGSRPRSAPSSASTATCCGVSSWASVWSC